MRVGIVLPVRNSIAFIEECLTSIRNQTYDDVYAYVADDISDDGTYEWLKNNPSFYENLKRNSSRLGWPGNTNSAAQLAIEDGCDALYLMAADDYIHPNCIKALVTQLERNEKDWVVPYALVVGEGSHPHIGTQMISQTNAILADFKTWPPLIDKILIRTHIWEEIGGFSTDVSVPNSWGAAEDWEFWIKIFKSGYTNYHVIPENLYFYRIHPDQLWPAREAIHQQTIELIKNKHPDVWELPGGWGIHGY